MQLGDLFDYKNQFVQDVLTNEKIVSLLTDDRKLLADPSGLVYTQVFPYEYIPETVEHGYTFICCDVDIQQSINKTYLSPVLYVWVFCHQSKMKLQEGGVRTDRLAEEIAKTINGSRFYGLGELDLYSVKRFAPTTGYQGKVMSFYATEFNRFTPSGKPVPGNRKRGT